MNSIVAWWRTLVIELQNTDISRSFSPKNEMEPGDIFLGDADDDSKRLYCLSKKYEQSSLESYQLANGSNDENVAGFHKKKGKELQEKADILMGMFAEALRTLLNAWDKPLVGIRKDWKVVWTDKIPAGFVIGIIRPPSEE